MKRLLVMVMTVMVMLVLAALYLAPRAAANSAAAEAGARGPAALLHDWHVEDRHRRKGHVRMVRRGIQRDWPRGKFRPRRKVY